MKAFALLFSALAVLPSDRLMMADRLFNRGEYEKARSEYLSLEGEKTIAGDEVAYRLAESEKALGNMAAAEKYYRRVSEDFPMSGYADRSRLELALLSDGEKRTAFLKALDSDQVAAEVRSAALYHLGTELKDAVLLEKAVK